MTRLFYVLARLRYRVRLWWHEFNSPIRPGDPMLGYSREQRDRNIDMILDRWDAKAPRPPKAPP